MWRSREVFMGIVANVYSRTMASRRGVLITLVSVDNRVDKIVDKWAKSGCVWLCMAL